MPVSVPGKIDCVPCLIPFGRLFPCFFFPFATGEHIVYIPPFLMCRISVRGSLSLSFPFHSIAVFSHTCLSFLPLNPLESVQTDDDHIRSVRRSGSHITLSFSSLFLPIPVAPFRLHRFSRDRATEVDAAADREQRGLRGGNSVSFSDSRILILSYN